MPGPTAKPAPPPGFTANLLRANPGSLEDFAEWHFMPGMRFGEWRKWWDPAQGSRADAHEGLDLASYTTKPGRQARLPGGLRIPALAGGTVAGIIPDFLGQTIIITAADLASAPFRLVVFYAHLLPLPGLRVGDDVENSDQLGSLPMPLPHQACPPHLHLALALVHRDLALARFQWNEFRATEDFRPEDPYGFL